MRKIVTTIGVLVLGVSAFGQVSTSSSGRVNSISTDFSFNLTDGLHNRPVLKTGWISGIGDYLSIKHGGNNIEENTFGLRISDGYGFDFGINDFSTSFFKIKTNGNVGIGTTTPSQRLEIFNANPFNSEMQAQNQDHISLVSNDPGNGRYFGGVTWKSGGRRRASIVATREHTDSDYVGIAFFTKGIDGPGPIAESMRITRNGNVGIGTTDTKGYKLGVKGKIAAEEVKVALYNNWPDYVFEESYNLPTLEQVELHISENGHLINIPSAAEVEKNGILLGEMNAKLLEKNRRVDLIYHCSGKENQRARK